MTRRIQRQVTETQRALVAGIEPLQEGAYNEEKATLPITVIEPGFNKSKKRFYPAEMLKRDYKVFEGMKMFVDHSTLTQDRSRPEGSVRDWGANLSKLWVDGDGTVRGEAAIIDEQLKLKLANLRQHKQLPTMGISIRAIGEGHDAEVEGQRTLLVERLVKGRSVDFVTYAGAGGQVEAIESQETDEGDIDLVTLTQLRERRPDLVELIESEGGTTMNTEEQLREQLKQKEAEIKRLIEAADEKGTVKLKAELKETQEKLKKAEEVTAGAAKVTAIAEADKTLKKLLEESRLPKKAQERVLAQFKDAETDEGMKEAVESMIKFMKEVAPGKVRGLGESEGGDGYKVDMKKRIERFQRMGLSEAEAKVAAEGRR